MAKKKGTETKTETGAGTAVAAVEEPVVGEVPIPEKLAEEYDDILNPVKNKISNGVNRPPEGEVEKEEPEPEEPEQKVEPEGEPQEEDIPDRLVEAGRAHGLTDAKIIKLAEDDPEILEIIAQDYERLRTAAAEKITPKEHIEPLPKEEGGLKPIQVDTSRFDDETSQVVKTLVAEVNKDRDIINKLSESVSGVGQKLSAEEAKRQVDFDSRIDGIFDSVKDVPQFGKKESITTGQQKARNECYGIAFALTQQSGGTLEQNLQKAVKGYKGIYGIGDNSGEGLRAKLNKQKTKFTARPGGQKTQPTYKSEDEKGLAVMLAKGKELGIW